MRKIKLTQGKHALIDDEDYELFIKDSWFFDGNYAARKSPKKVYMHRIINRTPVGYVTDHINRNKLDNRRANLRTVPEAQNALNRSTRIDNKSGFPGVFWRTDKSRWIAYINTGGSRTYLGHYISVKDAIKARRIAEKAQWTI